MRTISTTRPHAAAVLAALATTGKGVGDGEAPEPPDDDPEDDGYPYVVLHDIPGGSLDGSIADPYADVVWAYQITSVGLTADQARWMADAANTALSSVITVPGRRVQRNEPVGGPGGIRRDDDLHDPTLFTHVAIWHLHTTPTT